MYSDNGSGGLGLALGLMGLFYLVVFALSVWVCWRITAKAGYSGWLSLLAFVPFVNMIAMVAFAAVKWPIEVERDALRAGSSGSYPRGAVTTRPGVPAVHSTPTYGTATYGPPAPTPPAASAAPAASSAPAGPAQSDYPGAPPAAPQM